MQPKSFLYELLLLKDTLVNIIDHDTLQPGSVKRIATS